MKEKAANRILVSACLLGASCRYDGRTNTLSDEVLAALDGKAELIPFCPEIYGGLSTPRLPSEIRKGRVFACDGREVTEQFEKGADEAVRMAERLGCQAALLKERSPSCGSHQVYDGTFSGIRTAGAGKAAERLMRAGIRVFSEEELDVCMEWIEDQMKEI